MNERETASVLFQVPESRVDKDQLYYAECWIRTVKYSRLQDNRPIREVLAIPGIEPMTRDERAKMGALTANLITKMSSATHSRKWK